MPPSALLLALCTIQHKHLYQLLTAKGCLLNTNGSCSHTQPLTATAVTPPTFRHRPSPLVMKQCHCNVIQTACKTSLQSCHKTHQCEQTCCSSGAVLQASHLDLWSPFAVVHIQHDKVDLSSNQQAARVSWEGICGIAACQVIHMAPFHQGNNRLWHMW